ncbi:MAG: hypothetical protein J6X56_10270 [Ruminococcus sp.]|nr:hypothetical protein [Ruminococcus sp.]
MDTKSEIIKTNSSDSKDIVLKMLDNIVLFGEKLSLPSSFDDFNDDYTATNGVPYKDYDMSTYTLYYKNKKIGFVDLSKNNDIHGLFIDNDIPNSNFNICDIGYNSNKADVINVFGEPTDRTEGSFIYGENENQQITFGFNGETIRSIKIFC